MLNNSTNKDIKIQIYHQLIGNHTFDLHQTNHITDLRTHIIENSPLYIYENFHLQHNNQPVYEYYQISQIFKTDARLTIVFDPYDYCSSRHHHDRVLQILNNPIKWTIINNRDVNCKHLQDFQQNFPAQQLQTLFQNPFTSIFLSGNQKKDSQFSNMLHPSGFNPVPNYRRYQGDLYYIHVKTLQQIDIHITASIDGFFVNLSHQSTFNPNPNPKYSTNISLLDLLLQISPKFKTQFQAVLKNTKLTQFQRILYNFKSNLDNFQWLKNSNGWKKINIWRNDCHKSQQNKDLHLIKDWMQIFQFYRNTSSETLYDKMNKQKIKYRVYKQFSQCATDGVMKIFSGQLKPINYAQKFIQQIFYFQYLLFYFVSDEGTEDLPKSQQINRAIINQHFLEQLQTQNLYLSNMIVVKYRGYKIVVRTFPNNFVTENITSKTIKQIFNQNNCIQNDQSFAQIIKKISKQLGLQCQNSFTNQKGQNVQIMIHPEINGCVTTDKKRILLNLTKLSPRDLNFEGIHAENCFLRPEIMKIYNIKQKCTIPYNSMIRTKYKIPSNEKNKIQQKKLLSLAKFAKEIMIPAFIDSFDQQMRKCLSDTNGIIQNLHRHGLSSKYLGLIYLKAIDKKSFHVKIMIQRVILIKSLKNLFRKALRETPLFYHKTIIKHLLNCLYDDENISTIHRNNSNQEQIQTNTTSKKTKKRKNKEQQTFFQISLGKVTQKYIGLTTVQFWRQLQEISLRKFKHKLSHRQTFFQFQFSKTAILRDICLCLGIQIERRNYFNGQSVVFNEQHILCMIPKIKIVMAESKQLNELIDQGDKFVAKYQLQEAFEAYNKALQFIFNVYNGIHQKLALINKKIADIYFKVGDIDMATLSALNACEIYQKLLGQDHVQTIQTFMMVGVYQFTRKKYSSAEYNILKALFLAKFSYSQCYPEVIIIYLNLSTVYQTQKKFTDAIMSLFMALNISVKVFGQKHLHTAIVFSALASLHFEIPDIQQCIKYQQKAIYILQENLGKSDERVIEARNVCQSYKNLQNSKKIREVHQKEQKNMFNSLQNNKINLKLPFYDFRESSNDFIWKKNKKMKYFF